MSTQSNTAIDSIHDWTSNRFLFDREGGVLAVLFLIVQLASVKLAEAILASGSQPTRPGGVSSDAAAGAIWAGAEVALAVVMLGVILLYKRAPEWLQKLIKWNALVGIVGWLGADAARSGAFPGGFLVVMGVLTVWLAADEFNVFWMLNNLLAVLLAIMVGAMLGFLFGITGLLIALGALTVYDHVFANKNTWMFDMAEMMLKLRLPVIFFRPASLRFDWNQVFDDDDDDGGEGEVDEPNRNQWGIGTADLALPAGFVAAVALAPTGEFLATGYTVAGFVVLGVVVACFRLRWEMMNQGSGAGLPALSSGAFGGWLVAQVLLFVFA